MASIRDLTKCIGVTSDNVSVLGHFFGFKRASLPAGAVVSVSEQIDRLAMPHFHVNVVRIGSDQFLSADEDDLDFAIIRVRDIYANHGFGVGRVLNWGVLTADADGLDTVTKKRELRQITQNWTIDNDGIDVFVPHNMNITRGIGFVGGLSAVNGTCDNKDKTTGLSGAVIDMNGSLCGTITGMGVGVTQTGRTMAHELGHYLGLFHKNHKPRNLMCQTGKTKNSCIATALTDHQKKNIRNHCAMKPGC
jgi:Metallo-peptidase family M12B Reprolysin-like